MLQRKITDRLIAWKKEKVKKSLILQGARQIGKTFSIREFGESNYEEMVELNFKETPSAKQIFSGDLNVDGIIMSLRFQFPDKKIAPGKTLIFFDEIQECAEAITSLKFWTSDGRYDVIASGSLLGIDYNRPSSYPVGYVEHMKMNALDFEEYLWNIGITGDMIAVLRECFEKRKAVPEAIHFKVMEYYRMYIATGGMPEAVWSFVKDRDFRIVDKIQRDILMGYQYDIAHYANAEEKVKAEKCFLSLSKQLLEKENHKFQYKEIEKGARAQKYYSSIEWLVRADIIQICKDVTDVVYDLDDYARDDFFRAYTTDLSLLIAMKDLTLKQQIVNNTIVGNTKGGIYECAVADSLYKNGFTIYFYKNESTRKEIDFLIQKEGEVIPVEVKGGNAKATSLNGIMSKYPNIRLAYKLIDGNVGMGGNGVVSLPIYMAMFI